MLTIGTPDSNIRYSQHALSAKIVHSLRGGAVVDCCILDQPAERGVLTEDFQGQTATVLFSFGLLVVESYNVIAEHGNVFTGPSKE